MAEEDAEFALLQQMQAGQDEVVWGQEAGDATEGDQLEDADNSDEQVKAENIADDPDLRAYSPSITNVHVDASAPTPSPNTPVTALGQELSRASSAASNRKRKTIAGFVADDSDSEDESTTSKPNLLQPPVNEGLTRSASRSPLHTVATIQDGTAVEDVSAIQTPTDVPLSTEASSVQIPVSAVQSSLATQPKARLPHDTVGILEDRIKEDPRGDVDAWVLLITEHRKRNKLDEARAVYDRCLKVFPHAVSYP